MKNKKNTRWTGFFTNLLGVILGISLTFGVNSLWQKREENKKIKEILILVRKELEVNKEWFKSHEKTMKGERYAYKKILEARGNIADIPIDTLEVWFGILHSFSDYQLTTTSWQIFQNSEMIQKITDKELVIRITDCYFAIEKFQELIMKEYWDKKKKAIVYDLNPNEFFEALISNKETVFFFTIMGEVDGHFTSLWDLFPMADAYIDYTIMLLDKYGNFRYDMDEKDKELESFVEARMDSIRNSKTDSLLLKNDTILNHQSKIK